METAAAEILLGAKLDKYRVEQRIGSGGMGIVYRGTHSWTERPVAIKVLHAILRPGAAGARRFLREARAAAALQHPNVVDVLDMGQDDAGRVYLVMGLLAGRSLRALLRETPRLSLPDALAYLLPIMDALARAHELGIVHRDIKPDNVFLAEEHGRVVPKLLDFGVAKLLDCAPTGPTESGALIGTPRYMAPEQFNCEPALGPAADIWGMGMTLFECLAGRLPFDPAPSLPALFAQRSSVDAVSLATYCPDLSPRVAAAVARALQRAPDARFSSIREFAAALMPATDASQSLAAVSCEVNRQPRRNAGANRRLWRGAVALTGIALLAWAFTAGSRSSTRSSASVAQPHATLPPAPREPVHVEHAANAAVHHEVAPVAQAPSTPVVEARAVEPSSSVPRTKTKPAAAKKAARAASVIPPVKHGTGAEVPPTAEDDRLAPPDIITNYSND